MQLDCSSTNLSALPALAFTARCPPRCPRCGDSMVAPVTSEFVEHGEIRHHWECDACGNRSCTSIQFERG